MWLLSQDLVDLVNKTIVSSNQTIFPEAKNNRAATHRESIRKEASDSSFRALGCVWFWLAFLLPCVAALFFVCDHAHEALLQEIIIDYLNALLKDRHRQGSTPTYGLIYRDVPLNTVRFLLSEF